MDALPLDALESGHDFADLRPWGCTLGEVRVVGLGEATHGTREFSTLKHRLIEYLVVEHGTRTVAFEASEAAATVVDRWVVDGVGDPRAALAGLGFWIWDTTEVLALLHALRTINAGRSRDERVHFVGVDPQLPGVSVSAVAGFLSSRGRSGDAVALQDLHPGRTPAPATLLARVADAVELVATEGDEHLAAHVRRVARAAALATTSRSGAASAARRDLLMAEATLDVVAPDAGPVALWAHNAHVARVDAPFASTGAHLRQALGTGYHALGLLVADSAFRALRSRGPWWRPGPVAEHRVGPAPATTVEARLVASHPGDHLVDLRDPALPAWLREPSPTRSFGAVAPRFPRSATEPIVPADEFDTLAVVARGHPSVPVAGRAHRR